MKYLLLILLISNLAFANQQKMNGNGVGNGGDVVVCGENIELLDFYEFNDLDLKKSDSEINIARSVFKGMKEFNPKLYKQYNTVLDGIEKRVVFVKDANFRDIKDSFHISLKYGCEIKQIAIQQNNAEGKKEIHISKNLWDKLSYTHKAGLLVHEIIYEHFNFLGEENSLKVREFTRLLFSKKIQSMSAKDFRAKLRKFELALY